MKIALFYPWIYVKGGIERSILELVNRSEHEWTLFTNRYAPENTFEGFSKLDVRELRQVTVKRDMRSVLSAAGVIARQKLPLEGFDALLVWCDGLGTLVTFRNHGLPTICVCSTPLRPVYDPVYEKVACKGRKFLARLAYYSFKHLFRIVDRIAWKNFHTVVSTSTEVSNRIIRNGLYPDNEQLKLAYPGIDSTEAVPLAELKYEPYLLVPGRIMWTKNIELAIEAFKLADLPKPWKLVIAGFLDEKSVLYYHNLMAMVDGDPRIEFVVSPSDDKLNELYRNAYSILFTPLNEDWGIVPLEGMLRAKPIMAVASGGPAESIIDGKTGWLLNPSPGVWAEKLKSIVSQPEQVKTMGAHAQQHVKRYDWGHFVAEVDNALREPGTLPAPAHSIV